MGIGANIEELNTMVVRVADELKLIGSHVALVFHVAAEDDRFTGERLVVQQGLFQARELHGIGDG